MHSPKRSEESLYAPEALSPFSQTHPTLPVKRPGRSRVVQWIGGAVLLVVIGAVSGVFLTRYLNDPYRTLQPFPVAKYLDGHRAVTGAKFRGELRVEADLGWKEGIGRLMLFSAEGDSRPLAVMIPAGAEQNIYFTKGQTYLSELEVREGGLIYANSVRKN